MRRNLNANLVLLPAWGHHLFYILLIYLEYGNWSSGTLADDFHDSKTREQTQFIAQLLSPLKRFPMKLIIGTK